VVEVGITNWDREKIGEARRRKMDDKVREQQKENKRGKK